MKPSLDQSLAGILEPVFAIRTEDDLGVGDTNGVCQMIDWCHRHHLNIFQTLPINETGDDNSPYNAISSLAIDPSTMAVSPSHISDLTTEKFNELATPELLGELRVGPVNYPKVKALKRALLSAAFNNFFANHYNKETARAKEFQVFVDENRSWLSDYALFRVLMEAHGDSPAWDRWPARHRTPNAARTWLTSLSDSYREELRRKELFFQYVQWIAFSQWLAVRARAEQKRIFLIGDISFGVSRHSADVWANRAIFNLDWSGGAPPEKTFKVDRFTEKWGQNWGIPLYRWSVLRRRNFDWWRTRINNISRIFHFYRIDHVLGFFRIYAFPWTPDRNVDFVELDEKQAAEKTGNRLPGFKAFPDETPEQRAANQKQGEELLRMVLDASGETAVIAEDLGVVPDYVSPTLQKLHIPGFRVPFFLRDHDWRFCDPKTYPRLSITQPATHDHPPLAAVWADYWANIDAGTNAEHSRWDLKRIMWFGGLKDEETPREFTDRIREAFTCAIMQSPSWLVVFQITDIFGQTDRFNVPGSTASSNWSHRLSKTIKQFDSDPQLAARAKTFSRLAKESGRTF